MTSEVMFIELLDTLMQKFSIECVDSYRDVEKIDGERMGTCKEVVPRVASRDPLSLEIRGRRSTSQGNRCEAFFLQRLDANPASGIWIPKTVEGGDSTARDHELFQPSRVVSRLGSLCHTFHQPSRESSVERTFRWHKSGGSAFGRARALFRLVGKRSSTL